MLSLPDDGRYPELELTPPQRRQKTLEALSSAIRTFIPHQSGADDFRGCPLGRPTSLEAFGRTVDRINTFRAVDRYIPARI